MTKHKIKQVSFLIEEWLWDAFVKEVEALGRTPEETLRRFIKYHVTGEM